MMTAGPWRLDALEILRGHSAGALRPTAGSPIEHGSASWWRPGEATPPDPSRPRPSTPETRAKLRRLLETLDELNPLTWREGPFTILERFLERTGQVLDLIAADTLESQRMVANIASFLRFAADWQARQPERARWPGSSTTSTRTRRPAASCRRAWS